MWLKKICRACLSRLGEKYVLQRTTHTLSVVFFFGERRMHLWLLRKPAVCSVKPFPLCNLRSGSVDAACWCRSCVSQVKIAEVEERTGDPLSFVLLDFSASASGARFAIPPDLDKYILLSTSSHQPLPGLLWGRTWRLVLQSEPKWKVENLGS